VPPADSSVTETCQDPNIDGGGGGDGGDGDEGGGIGPGPSGDEGGGTLGDPLEPTLPQWCDDVFRTEATEAWNRSVSGPPKTEYGFAIAKDGTYKPSGPGSQTMGDICALDLYTFPNNTLYTFHTHPPGCDNHDIPDDADKTTAKNTNAPEYVGTNNGLYMIAPNGTATKVAPGASPSEWFKACTNTSK
jgi:hypothetical protein